MFTVFRSKEAGKMQWLQDPIQSNTDNVNNVRRENNKHLGTKRRNI